MQIMVKMAGIEEKSKLIQRKNTTTGEKEDAVETVYVMKVAMKKIKYDKLENVKPGTNDPWVTCSITSFDEKFFDEFRDTEMGTELVMTIEPQ